MTRFPQCKNIASLPAVHQQALVVTLIAEVNKLLVPARVDCPVHV